MIFRQVFLAALAVMAFTIPAFADEPKHDLPPPATNAIFEKIKTLAGEWTGISTMGEEKSDTTVRYTVTSGGNAVLETLFAGQPHEMTSVYFPEGDGVRMVHYCALGNRPELTATPSADAEKMSFVMDGVKGLNSPDEAHIHALTVTFNADGSMVHEWASREKGGVEDHKTSIVLKRKAQQ